MRHLQLALARHKKKAACFFLAGTALTTLFCLAQAPSFTSEAKLLVRLGRESVAPDPTVTARQLISVSATRESEINSEIEILTSREVLERALGEATVAAFEAEREKGLKHRLAVWGLEAAEAVAELAYGPLHSALAGVDPQAGEAGDGALARLRRLLADRPPDAAREEILRAVRKDLAAVSDRHNNVFTVRFAAPRPELARAVLGTTIEAYLERRPELQQASRSQEFLAAQVAQKRRELAEVEGQLRRLKDEAGVASLPDQIRVQYERIAGLQKDLDGARAQLAAARASAAALEATIANAPETVVAERATGFPNETGDALRATLADLMVKERELLVERHPNSVEVRGVQEQIDAVRRLLSKEEASRTRVTTSLNGIRQELLKQLNAERARAAALVDQERSTEAALAAAQAAMARFNGLDLQVNELTRRARLLEQDMARYSDSLEQARIDNALDADRISNISLVQAPTLPGRPDGLPLPALLLLGLCLSGTGAIGLALACERLDDTLRSPEDVTARIGAPLLAALPWAEGRQRRRDAEIARAMAGGACCGTLLGRILLLPPAASPSAGVAVGVVGTGRGEGVSTLIAGIAHGLRLPMERGILVVGAREDIERAHAMLAALARVGGLEAPAPSIAVAEAAPAGDGQAPSGTELQPSPGRGMGRLLDRLAHDREPEAGIRLLIADPERDLGRLAPHELERLVGALRQRYALTLFDLRPLGAGSTTLRLGHLLDGMVLVAEAERQPWHAAREAWAQLQEAQARLLGVALTKCRRLALPRPRRSA